MISAPERTVCACCGEPVTEAVGCLPCLLGIGFDAADASPSALPEQLANYRIALREDGSRWELGRGSMGITYRAIDTTLDRAVALKVVAPEHAGTGDAARARFLREARVAAGLRHQNIATVYHCGVDEETGQFFYAMELVEGETLEERVRRTGPLDAPTAIAIAQQVIEALAAAEKNGLVHRDLKPANLMLSAGGETTPIVKIIDFGLAKALTAEVDPAAQTQGGGFVGTPAFASPEQFARARLDVRSDIYSLGATLWFALTGKRPFAGNGVDEIREAQAKDALPVEQLRAARVPARLSALLASMLAHEPAARPGVAALREQLRRTSRPHPHRVAFVAAGLAAILAVALFAQRYFYRTDSMGIAAQKSVAVLPFEDSNSTTGTTALADGIHENLLVALSKIADLKVISRNSVMQYRGTGRDLREIGRALGVSAVLEGRVRHEGNQAHINVQLIKASDGAQLWAANYERETRNSFAAENDIALQIATALKGRVSALDAARIKRPLTGNPDAYLRFVEAKNLYLDYRKLRPDLEKAEQLLDEAIRLDPKFAAAYARLSQVDNTLFEMYGRAPQRRAQALAAAHAALKLQPDLPEAHVALGLDYWRSNVAEGEIDYENALREFALAEHGLPNDPEVATFIGRIERHQGKWASSTAHLAKAVALDPRSVERWHRLFFNYEATRNFARAAAVLDHVIGLAAAEDRWRFLNHRARLLLLWKGDLSPSKNLPAPPPNDPLGPHTETLFKNAMLLRDYDEAEKILLRDPRDVFTSEDAARTPKALYLGRLYHERGDEKKARENYEVARVYLEQMLAAHPRDRSIINDLAETYARLGRKDDAITEARKLTEIYPLTKDAWLGAVALRDFAAICVMTGDVDQAFPPLARSLSLPGGECRNALRFDRVWDPMREDPRFQELISRPDVVVPVGGENTNLPPG